MGRAKYTKYLNDKTMQIYSAIEAELIGQVDKIDEEAKVFFDHKDSSSSKYSEQSLNLQRCWNTTSSMGGWTQPKETLKISSANKKNTRMSS